MMNIFHLFLQDKLSNHEFVLDNRLYRIINSIIPGLSFALMIILSQSLFAQNYRWTYVATDANKALFYFDKTSIKKKGNFITTWEKTIFFDGSYHIILSQWDCEKKRTRINIVNVYDPWGKFIGWQKPTEWSEIAPESIAEAYYRRLCKTSDLSLIEKRQIGSLRVIVQQANVRELPSMDSAVVKKVRKGAILQLVNKDSSNGWYQIYITDNETAWIHGNTVEFIEVRTPPRNNSELPSDLLN